MYNPKMISLAREARELVQSELAVLLGISQGKLSKLEGGVIAPSDDTIAILSKVLNFPVEFFKLNEDTHGIGTEAFHQLYRRRKALPSKALRRIEAHVNIVRIHTSRLLRSVALDADRTIPRFDLEDFDGDVETVAGALRALWQLPSGPVSNLVQLIEAAGGLVIPFDFGTELVDATSLRVKDLPPLIFYNIDLTWDRCRFTLAHELGHLVMHSVAPGPDMENEADRFAAEFLMPAAEIGPQLANMTLARAAHLKPYWKVSMAALVYRAKELGKLSQSQAQRLWVTMSAAGIRKREPAELDIPPEWPRTHKELIDFHLNDLGYSNSELCQLLASNDEDFQKLHCVNDRSPVRLVGGSRTARGAAGAEVLSFPNRGR